VNPDSSEPPRGEAAAGSPHDRELNEWYFRALTERSSELVCVLDDDGRIVYVNPAGVQTFGYPAEEVLGHSAFDFVAAADLPRIQVIFTTLLSEPGGVATAEYAVVHRDGTSRIISAVARNLLHDPAVRGIVLNAHDVTEPRRTEQALRESEARLAHIASNLPVMIYRWVYQHDGTGAYTDVSEGARSLFGVDPAAARKDPNLLVSLLHPDERDRFISLARVAAASLGSFRWEGRLLLPSGEERHVQIAASTHRKADGCIVSDGVVMDTSALHEAYERLERNEQQYRSLFDYNPDAVFSFDTEGRFVSANPACEALSGYKPEELLLGTSWAPLVCPEEFAASSVKFGAAVAGQATQYETTIRHRDGHDVRLGITNIPIIVSGRVVGVFGVAKDLTKERGLEEQLREAQRLESVGRLAGGVAHDFNNLLTVISGYTEMALAKAAPGDPLTGDLRRVLTASDQASSLTRQLLAFSRRQMLAPRQLDLNRIVSDATGMLGRLIGEDIVIQTELAPSLWPVRADPGQLNQVILNLSVNARDAMPAGGTLSLRTSNVRVDAAHAAKRAGLAPGDYACLVVEDTGTGIDPEALPHIFEPFYTTKAIGTGTGLGLATVYGIVKQSDGFLYVDSALGAGAQFTLLLPRSTAASETVPAPAASALPRGSETILLVEDAEPVRRVVQRMLGNLGYAVLEAGSVADAMRIARAAADHGDRIDLVLTDVVMPGEGGRALGERLAEEWPSLKVLYMSGYTDDEILRRGLVQSGTAFLEKPFTPARLAEAVRGMLDRGNPGPA
jgi:PAS domain S-box-containing protein